MCYEPQGRKPAAAPLSPFPLRGTLPCFDRGMPKCSMLRFSSMPPSASSSPPSDQVRQQGGQQQRDHHSVLHVLHPQRPRVRAAPVHHHEARRHGRRW
jgi:hypothetical protein